MLRISSFPSGSLIFSDEALDKTYHFKWRSIGNLLYLTMTYSAHPPFFHMFNDDLTGSPVTVLHFTATAITVGMTYMCVDLFIKQYTRRLDWDQNLSPLFKGITMALILQSTLFCFLSLRYAGDGARYLASSLATTPIWSVCSQHDNSTRCMGSSDFLKYCETPQPRELLSLNETSVHIFYTTYMISNIRGAWTWRFFVSAVIWVLNFCLTTTPDSVVLKVYKYITVMKQICVILTCAYLAISTGRGKDALFKLMDSSGKNSLTETVVYVGLVYGIGLVGVYDFGSTSPFTMVDNAVVIFTICFILISIIRSMIVNILILELKACLHLNSNDESLTWHYIFFVIMPLSTEFLYGQRLVNISLYLHVLMSLLPCLMLYTLTMTRLFHSEFPSVKFIYIQGLLCLFGFCASVPVLLFDQYVDQVRFGLIEGVCITILYLGGLRMAIIMWVYGVKKFATDINFWLGFSPPRFWIMCWSVLPVVLWVTFGFRIYELSQDVVTVKKTCALTWFLASALIVFVFHIRTIVVYVMNNNLLGAFRSNKKYGPFDARDRKRRRGYDVTVDHRQCFHDCMAMDEEVDCNHLPLMYTGEGYSTNESDITILHQMYENVPSRIPSDITAVETKLTDTKEKQA